jgi:hypothetical protein
MAKNACTAGTAWCWLRVSIFPIQDQTQEIS